MGKQTAQTGTGKGKGKGKRTFATQTPTAPPTPPSIFANTNPTGRADIALSRAVEFGVRTHGDPLIMGVFASLKPLVEIGCTALAGPLTVFGRTSKASVEALHKVKRMLDEAEGKGAGV